MADLLIQKAASISSCGAYRTRITRVWDAMLPLLPFWLLNPSKADAEIDDPTLRRGMHFGRREGKGGIVFGNAYSYRCTNPKDLPRDAGVAFGPDNYVALQRIAEDAAASQTPIVCGWGAHPIDEDVWYSMAEIVKKTGVETVCLGRTKYGFPRHPLYVRNDAPLIPFYFMKYPFESAA